MRKFGCFFSLIVICLFINISYVNADDTVCIRAGYNSKWSNCTKSNTKTYSSSKDYTYEIWQTYFQKTKIVVKGYAFNNSVSTSGNKYKLVAKQGNKSVVSAWVSGTGGTGNLSNLHYVSDGCKSSKYTDVKGTYDLLINLHDRASPFCGLKKSTYTNYSFKNVEFNIELSINKILEKFNTTDYIYLYLITKQGSKYYLKKIYTAEDDIKEGSGTSDIYTKISGGDFEKAKFNTGRAWIRNSYNNYRKSGDDSNSASSTNLTGKFIDGENYEIKNVINDNKPRLYGLVLCKEYYTKGGDKYYYGTIDHKCKSGTFTGYAYSTWLSYNSYTKFKIKKNVPPDDSCTGDCCDGDCDDNDEDDLCTPELCIGGNCTASMNSDCSYDNAPKSISTDSSGSGIINSCSNKNETISRTSALDFDGILYYKISNGVISFSEQPGKSKYVSYSLCGDGGEILHSGNDYYVPIKFISVYEYTEKYDFSINGFTNNTVYNGLGFTFGFTYNLDYSRSLVNLNFEGSTSNSFTGNNNSYIGKVAINVSNNGVCQSDTAYIRLSSTDKLYYKHDSGFSYINYDKVYSYLSSTVNDNNDPNIKSNKNLEVRVDFPNSNSKDGSPHYIHSDGLKFNSCDSSECYYEYNLPTAFMNSEGNKKYNDSSDGYTTNLGEKYYIPFEWNDKNNFNFTIRNDTDLSIIDGLTINLNATCTVKTEDKFSKIRYRSISVDDPFPKSSSKSSIPSNWSDWYCGDDTTCSSSNSNKIRMSNSYNKKFYERLFTKDNFVEINNINTSYLSWQYMLPDSYFPSNGVSSFVSKWYNNFSSNSFCKIGQFDNSCDNYGS